MAFRILSCYGFSDYNDISTFSCERNGFPFGSKSGFCLLSERSYSFYVKETGNLFLCG